MMVDEALVRDPLDDDDDEDEEDLGLGLGAGGFGAAQPARGARRRPGVQQQQQQPRQRQRQFGQEPWQPSPLPQQQPPKPRKKPWISDEVRGLVLRASAAYGVASVLAFLAIAVAIFLYVSVYYQVMPKKLAMEVELYFDFDPQDQGQTGLDTIASSTVIRTLAALPVAEVDLHRASRQWTLARPTHEDAHEAAMTDVVLAPGFLYDISLQLSLPPAEDRLRNVGNFMVSAKLASRKKHELARSKRPALALARPRPKARRALSWLGIFIPFIYAWHSEEYDPALEEALALQAGQLVFIEVFEGYRERYEHEGRVRFITVQLSSPLVQLHAAQLHLHCRLEGIAHYMYHYFVTTFAVYLFAVSSVVAFGVYGMATAFSLFSAFSALAGDDENARDDDGDEMAAEFDYYGQPRGRGRPNVFGGGPGFGNDDDDDDDNEDFDSGNGGFGATPRPGGLGRRQSRGRAHSRPRAASRSQSRSQSRGRVRLRAAREHDPMRAEDAGPTDLPDPPSPPLTPFDFATQL